MRAVAVNVGANTNEPGFRSPVYPDGTWEFVPIPEQFPTAEPVPTYADLDLRLPIPPEQRTEAVHLDPEFPSLTGGQRWTYGDPWGVKARPLLDLSAGDLVCFYASLAPRTADGALAQNAAEHPPWVVEEWGVYIVGVFHLAQDPVSGDAYRSLPPEDRRPFANNAHVKRETFDAAVLLLGDERSRLLERPVAFSAAEGATPNRLVTTLSSDSGAGPWWRRPLRFEAAATEDLVAEIERLNPPPA